MSVEFGVTKIWKRTYLFTPHSTERNENKGKKGNILFLLNHKQWLVFRWYLFADFTSLKTKLVHYYVESRLQQRSTLDRKIINLDLFSKVESDYLSNVECWKNPCFSEKVKKIKHLSKVSEIDFLTLDEKCESIFVVVE